MDLQKKILLVQLYSNGDCLYATAVARQIKEDFPGSHLTWAIASFCKSIIDLNPFVDEIMEVKDVAKNDVAAFRRFRKGIYARKKNGEFDEVFITHNIDRNHAFYDGCIRSSILKAYPHPVTVPVTPVLCLSEKEINNARVFAEKYKLAAYRNVVLFEYAPQSGQSKITKQDAIYIAEGIVKNQDTAIILSSANKIEHINKAVIDGSSLTLRETAALTHYCSLLLGTSSGITWISTADSSKKLPMIQVLNPFTTWVNPISRDHQRFGFPVDTVIELLTFDAKRIIACVSKALHDFKTAREEFNQPIPLHFKTTRSIVYNLLCYFEFNAIALHVKVNRQTYGQNLGFYRELIIGFLEAPFILIKNFAKKKVFKYFGKKYL